GYRRCHFRSKNSRRATSILGTHHVRPLPPQSIPPSDDVVSLTCPLRLQHDRLGRSPPPLSSYRISLSASSIGGDSLAVKLEQCVLCHTVVDRATQLDATGETIARVREEHASPDAAIEVTKLILYESRRDGIHVDRSSSFAVHTQEVVTPPDTYPIHLATRDPVNSQL